MTTTAVSASSARLNSLHREIHYKATMEELSTRAKDCRRVIDQRYPCRSDIITKLFVDLSLGQSRNVALPHAIYIVGDNGTGKTSVLTNFLRQIPAKSVIIDCVECYTSKIIYETVLNQMFDHQLSAANNYASYRKCDNARDFVETLSRLDTGSASSYVIMFDDAHRLRELEANVLTVFLRLRETTRLNVCCMFVATLPFANLYPTGSFPLPIEVHWPNYTQLEVFKILRNKFDDYITNAYQRWVNPPVEISREEAQRRRDILYGLRLVFFENYLNLFLKTLFRTCRDLKELQLMSGHCFEKYCEPLILGTTDADDVRTLYMHIAATLKAAVNTIYMKIDQNDFMNLGAKKNDNSSALATSTGLAQQMPYYAKYLLIAAYLASHNDVKLDKRLFMKHHGKQKKTQITIKAKQMVSEKLSTQLGPKSFPIDRLMAIFYSIVDEKVPLTCNLMAQIPSLVHLKLLNFVSGENNIMEGSARLQCNVSLEFILQIGRNVGFNVRQYIGDFI